jgi:hypothetical protein
MPTLAGFIVFIRQIVGILPMYLPDDSPFIIMSYNTSLTIVNLDLACIDTFIYQQAVYNLASDTLLNYAPDQIGQDYFATIRKTWGINGFVPGVITSSSDESTSESLLNPDFMRGLTLGNLQNIKTPYGRTYLSYAQDYGQLWGMS